MRIMHIAAFSGNIGDCANHRGFYGQFNKYVYKDYALEQIEIRKFYRKNGILKFDQSFIEKINQFDLLILGGGGFFDLQWEYSHTGTTMDFSAEFIDAIRIPVLVNAMGYHEFDTTNSMLVEKFKGFLIRVATNTNWKFFVRNDGSLRRLKDRYGSLASFITSVPDSGFFYKPQHTPPYRGFRQAARKWLGMCITNDLFSDSFNNGISADEFNGLMIGFINSFLRSHPNYGLMLFPHTPQDIQTDALIMQGIDGVFVRERIVTAPYLPMYGETIDYVFDMYSLCECIVGMRFHTNVCCLAMNLPVIGLAGHEQISSLFDELSLPEQCVIVDDRNFPTNLSALVDSALQNPVVWKKNAIESNKMIQQNSKEYFVEIKEWLQSIQLIGAQNEG